MNRLISLILLGLALSAFAGAANQVGLTPRGNTWGSDTLWAGYSGWFEISIANDVMLGGLSIGFIMSGTAEYEFYGVADGFPVNPEGPRFVRGIPGSRWMSGEAEDGSCWDLGGTQVNGPTDNYPNQFLIGGAALMGNLAPGPLQPMLEVHYRVPCWSNPSDVRQLCIDSMKYGHAGDFVFVPGGTPEVLWGGSPLCFAVSALPCGTCPVWDNDNPTSMTVHLGDTGQVTLSATNPVAPGDPVYYYLVDVTGGTGIASVGVNDGLVTYIPDPADLEQNIQIVVEATDAIHQQGGCLFNALTLDVIVTDNHPPIIDRGRPYHYAAPPNVMSKNDITVEDPDSTDTHTFFISSISPPVAGTMDIDPASAALTYIPVAEDLGMHEACVGVTDGIDSATCCFTIEVLSADCCPGDMGFDGSVNIGDAVFLVTYIFKNGPPPQIMNFADVNADCTVNVADAVYLINYIFKGGPEPQVGCYY